MSAERALLAASIDYAGLFPPASLPMAQAVAGYRAYRIGGDRWALGRFVVPAARVGEMAREIAAVAPDGGTWPLSVLLGDDPGSDLRRAEAALDGGRPGVPRRARVECVELRATTAQEVRARLAPLPPTVLRYVELPYAADPRPLIAAVGEGGGYAKIRTGGTTADAFPAAGQLVRFIRACLELGVPFKATAGLHHPLRAEYPLTYAPDAPRGTMFGYLNVLLAAAFMRMGMPDDVAERLVEERDPSSLRVDDGRIVWREWTLREGDIAAARREGMHAFGSCSFREPVDELAALSLAGAR